MSDAKQPTPPVTKNQSLADILNEIESRANKATVSHRYEDHRDAFQDVPKLVKALRKLWDAYEDHFKHNPELVAYAKTRLAAILTSPENGEQQSQSLGEPGAVYASSTLEGQKFTP